MYQNVGLALGGGGAKGLTHVNFLEEIDDYGLPIHQIAGTSIGAIFGASYAAGIKPSVMREYVESISFDSSGTFRQFLSKDILKWFNFIDMQFSGGSLFSVDDFLDELMDIIKVTTFEELQIPTKIVASNFWNRSQKVFSSGDLRTAIQASMALPVLFEPVIIDGTVLVDGGAVNPVPYDLLEGCDLRIAINVMGQRKMDESVVPSLTESLFNTFQIMQNSILVEKLKNSQPDILISPDLPDIQLLDFLRAQQILAQGDTYKDLLRTELEGLETAVS